MRLGIRTKALSLLALVALMVVISYGAASYTLRRKALLEEFQGLTRSIAATAATAIPGEELSLVVVPEDVALAEFTRNRDRLIKVRDANGLKDSEIYVVRVADRAKAEVEFVLMADAKPYVGNVYTIRPENRAAFEQALTKGIATSTAAYSDEHGSWISSFAPIRNAAGEVSEVLEVDQEISRYVQRLTRELLIEIAAAAGTFLLVLIPGLFLVNRLTGGLRQLTDAMRRFEAGENDVRVALNSKDEVEELAHSFNSMTMQLEESTRHLVETNEQLYSVNQALENRTGELNYSLAMTSTILATVHEGLLLLDIDGTIRPSYSAELEKIFRRQNLGGGLFADLIRQRVSPKTHELTVRFLAILFNAQKAAHMLQKLNPLKEVEVVTTESDGQARTQYLAFSFDRVIREGVVAEALVTIVDVTARVRLAQELKESQEKNSRQGELLIGVLHVEPAMLRDFITGARQELEAISAEMRKEIDSTLPATERQQHYKNQLNRILRAVHNIKGNAAVLKIGYFEQSAHRFEDKHKQLQNKFPLSGEDFVAVVLDLSELIGNFDEIREVVARIGSMHAGLNREQPAAAAVESPADPLSGLDQLASEVAARQGRKVRLITNGFDTAPVPAASRRPLRDALIQLVRNSVTHGIETPAERGQAGKEETGSIHLSAQLVNGALQISLRDDGRGLDYRKIIDRARELDTTEPGLLRSLVDATGKSWSIPALNEAIFRPGFSTRAQADSDAGRGVGLDVVRQALAGIGGSVHAQSQPGSHCEFLISLPSRL